MAGGLFPADGGGIKTGLVARKPWQALEDRFQSLVEGGLAAAFAKRSGQEVEQLVGMMVAISRSGTVEKLYIAARIPSLQVRALPLRRVACPGVARAL
jgi:hypothetical protein